MQIVDKLDNKIPYHKKIRKFICLSVWCTKIRKFICGLILSVTRFFFFNSFLFLNKTNLGCATFQCTKINGCRDNFFFHFIWHLANLYYFYLISFERLCKISHTHWYIWFRSRTMMWFSQFVTYCAKIKIDKNCHTTLVTL